MIIWILIIIMFFIYFFNQKFRKVHPKSKSISINKQKNIFLYWENMPGKTKPNYLNLCYKTIIKHCNKNFKIHLLDNINIHKFLPNLRKDLDKKLTIGPAQKTDYYRYYLLYKYGGIWIDFDTIILKDLTPLFNKLNEYNFVGFGCHFRNCSKTGFPYPANWLMMSRKNDILMKNCLDKCNYYLNNYNNILFNTKYFILGRENLTNQIKKLLYINNGWKYYHHASICTERDSNDNKLFNRRMISDEDIDSKCIDKSYFVPIYNTAPGFPDSFLNLTEKEIMEKNMLISKYFRKSLK